jgi:hypothetical protein
MAKTSTKAKWIWLARECHAEDCYVRARRQFTLGAIPKAARLRITAFSEYALYVNGQYVGSGPCPSSPERPLLDVYALADLPLKRGSNVIGVLAHNSHLGLTRQARVPGGLWLELEVTPPRGRPQMIVSDRHWRIAVADDFSRRAPRIYWTAGFTEVRDTRLEPALWLDGRFSDRRWAHAEEVQGAWPEHWPEMDLAERPAPRPAERFVLPHAVAASGRVSLPAGVTAIPFEFAVPDPAHGEFYAGTFIHTKGRQRARLVFDCDEAAAVYVNNRLVLRQAYDEGFVHWLQEGEHDDYAGIHRGQGPRQEAALATLDPGWNSVGVVIYDPGASWGFAMRFLDARTGEPLPLAFSPDMQAGTLAHWHVVREQLCPCGDGALPETPAPNARTFPDAAALAAWETRTVVRRPPPGAAALTARPRGTGPLVLADGEFVAYDFGRVVAGYVEIDVEAPAGAILDLAWRESPDPAGRAGPVPLGIRRADRLVLAGGRRTVRLFNRRTLRYLDIIARPGDAQIKIHRAGVHALGPADEPAAGPRTDDAPLAAALDLCSQTARVCLQHTLEGSPGRDADQSAAATMMLAQAEQTLFGRTDLTRAALEAFIADQRPDGCVRAIVPSGTQHVVPDWTLLWVIALADAVAWTGDRTLAQAGYPAAVRALEWTAQFRGASGLLENPANREPWWLFVDLSPTDKRGEPTAWQALWARALHAEAALAEFLGLHEDAAHARAEADEAAAIARERLWDGGRGLFLDARQYDRRSPQASAAANAYALYGGLASPEQAERILSALWPDSGSEKADWGPRENPFVRYFALETLFERGRAAAAINMIRRYWGGMADAGLTTVPEVWPLPDMRACLLPETRWHGPFDANVPPVMCHGWGVHPATLVARYVLGVRPAGPGFDPMLLAPQPGDLRGVSGRIWTPRGTVEVSIEPRGRHRVVRAALPADMPYRLDRRGLAPEDDVEVTGGRAPEV